MVAVFSLVVGIFFKVFFVFREVILELVFGDGGCSRSLMLTDSCEAFGGSWIGLPDRGNYMEVLVRDYRSWRAWNRSLY